jgi:hypothetical protein
VTVSPPPTPMKMRAEFIGADQRGDPGPAQHLERRALMALKWHRQARAGGQVPPTMRAVAGRGAR